MHATHAVSIRWLATAAMIWVAMAFAALADETGIEPFLGDYTGSAELVNADGTTEPRDMSVSISETKDGFNVSWATVAQKSDGRVKESAFSIDFLPTDRDGIFSAAMQRNVFGHAVQLDPMKGEPFVWGRIAGDTLTVYSLFVSPEGGYELQQFDRILAEGGLRLRFSRIANGEISRTVETFLERQ